MDSGKQFLIQPERLNRDQFLMFFLAIHNAGHYHGTTVRSFRCKEISSGQTAARAMWRSWITIEESDHERHPAQ